MIKKFISKFTSQNIKYVKRKNKFFFASEELLKTADSVECNICLLGVFLGEEKKGRFFPSLALLDLLSKMSNEKVFVNSIGELDFLYGRDLKSRHISRIEGDVKEGFLKLVQNERDENLGYGKLAEGKAVLKNRLDRGDFLRRENGKVKKETA